MGWGVSTMVAEAGGAPGRHLRGGDMAVQAASGSTGAQPRLPLDDDAAMPAAVRSRLARRDP
jgi:hypothetical protein